MKSFNTVYNKERNNAINEHKSVIDNDHARLLAAIKKEYGITKRYMYSNILTKKTN